MGAETGFPRKNADKYYTASLAREYTEQAIGLLAAIMCGDGAALARLSGKNEFSGRIRIADRIRAAEILLERGWGKAPQEVKIAQDSFERNTIEVTHTVVHTSLVNGQPPTQQEGVKPPFLP